MIDIDELLNAKEGENLEFKEAKNSFSLEILTSNACALANLGGGKIVLGVSDKRPRQVVGTNAFSQPEEIRRKLIDILKINVDFEILNVPKRVLIFIIASRPFGLPIQVKGVAYWKNGDSIIPMPSEIHRRIYEESGHDFSADICQKATLDDLDKSLVEGFRDKWYTKNKNTCLKNLDWIQVLRDCEAITTEGVTYAALILFGKKESLGRFLAQSKQYLNTMLQKLLVRLNIERSFVLVFLLIMTVFGN
ncbi:MAG: putative DNA binding domain-containing protein [Planctomycetia bacterium]|nr:putative DNA binding domain-containing protein [Planctomycetia bacterium]